MTHHVAIVVLNWNNYEDTAACLRSLSDVTYPSMNVYVADNGSTDGSGERLATEFSDHEFVFNGENLGFAAGCNPAIDRALEDGADYVLLLNNDATVSPGFLSPLVESAENHTNAAIVGGIIRTPDGAVQSAGGRFNPTLTTLRHHTDVPDTVSETQLVSGALMLIDAEYLQSQDGLDESYFFGMEDQTLCWNARQQGLHILVDPRSEIVHQKGGTAEQHSPFRYYHDTYNRVLFARNHLTGLRLLAFILFFVFSRLYRWSELVFAGSTESISASLLALKDIASGHRARRPGEF